MKKMLIRATVAAVLVCSTAGAYAFADDDARRAILDLREQVKTLQTQELDARLKLTQQIEELREQNRKLTGQIEELTFSLSQEKQSTRKLHDDLDQRLQVFEPQTVTVDGATVKVQPQEKAAFDEAVGLVRAGDYKGAEQKFNKFISDWSKSPYLAEALYWRASSQFALEKYKATIASTDRLIRECPGNERIPDAMLLTASAQASAGSLNAAKNTYNKVIKQYPKSSAAKDAKQRLDTLNKIK